jgi:hypothetical protein
MDPKAAPDPALLPRNRSARASLVIALAFLAQCVAFVAIIAIGKSSWGVRLAATNPDHPFVNLAGLVVELGILVLPLDLIAGTLGILLGIRGRVVARRLPGNLGRASSIAGMVLAPLVLLVSSLIAVLRLRPNPSWMWMSAKSLRSIAVVRNRSWPRIFCTVGRPIPSCNAVVANVGRRECGLTSSPPRRL